MSRPKLWTPGNVPLLILDRYTTVDSALGKPSGRDQSGISLPDLMSTKDKQDQEQQKQDKPGQDVGAEEARSPVSLAGQAKQLASPVVQSFFNFVHVFHKK